MKAKFVLAGSILLLSLARPVKAATDNAFGKFYWDFPAYDVVEDNVNLYVPNNSSNVKTSGQQMTTMLLMATVPGDATVWNALGSNEYISSGVYKDDLFLQYVGTDGATYYIYYGNGASLYGQSIEPQFTRNSVNGTVSSNWTANIYEPTQRSYYSFNTQGTDIASNDIEVSNWNTCTNAVSTEWWTFAFTNQAGGYYYQGNDPQTSSDPATCTSKTGYTSGSIGSNPVYTWIQ